MTFTFRVLCTFWVLQERSFIDSKESFVSERKHCLILQSTRISNCLPGGTCWSQEVNYVVHRTKLYPEDSKRLPFPKRRFCGIVYTYRTLSSDRQPHLHSVLQPTVPPHLIFGDKEVSSTHSSHHPLHLALFGHNLDPWAALLW